MGNIFRYFPRVCGQNHQFLHLIFGLMIDRHVGPRSTDRMAGWDGKESSHDLEHSFLKNHGRSKRLLCQIYKHPLICSHVTSATFRFDEGNTLDELARSSKRASRFPEKCGRLPTPAYKKRCLAKDVPGGARINQNFQSAKVTVRYIIG